MNSKILAPYPQADCGMEVQPASLKERLTDQKQMLEKRLFKVNSALDALNLQPEVADLLEKVMKAL